MCQSLSNIHYINKIKYLHLITILDKNKNLDLEEKKIYSNLLILITIVSIAF